MLHDREYIETPPDPSSAPYLVQELARLTGWKRTSHQLAGCLAVACVGAGLAALGIRLFGSIDLARTVAYYDFGFGFAAIWLAYFGEARLYENGVARALERACSQGQCGVETVGPLAEAWMLERIDTDALLSALTLLLPVARPSNTILLSPSQRAALYATLAVPPERHSEYLVQLLDAIARLEDPSARPHVSRLLERVSRTPLPEPVREAAVSCLIRLDETTRTSREREHLLRPHDARSESLVRPGPHPSTAPGDLLRVEQAGEEQ